MNIATKFPTTRAERIELGADLISFPATWEEFLELLAVAEYRIEFEDNQIITMSTASNAHEAIVANLIFAFVRSYLNL